MNNVSAAPEDVPAADYPEYSDYSEKRRGSRSHLDDDESNYDKPPISYTPQWGVPLCAAKTVCLKGFLLASGKSAQAFVEVTPQQKTWSWRDQNQLRHESCFTFTVKLCEVFLCWWGKMMVTSESWVMQLLRAPTRPGGRQEHQARIIYRVFTYTYLWSK